MKVESCNIVLVVSSPRQELKVCALAKALADDKDCFFQTLTIAQGDINVPTATGKIEPGMYPIESIEDWVRRYRAHAVVVFGDGPLAMAGSIAARNAGSCVVHVEAGVRSWCQNDKSEAVRRSIDRMADLFFCSTSSMEDQLLTEGGMSFAQKAFFTGDLLVDVVLEHQEAVAEELPASFFLVWINGVQHSLRMAHLLGSVKREIVWPMTKDTYQMLSRSGLPGVDGICDVMEPQEALAAVAKSDGVITNSGNMAREAYVLGKPVIYMAKQLEWSELIGRGAELCDWEIPNLREAIDWASSFRAIKANQGIFGEGKSAKRMAKILKEHLRGMK